MVRHLKKPHEQAGSCLVSGQTPQRPTSQLACELQPAALIVCTACHQTKPAAKFHRKSEKTNGYDSRCKSCVGKARKARRKLKKQADEVLDLYNITFNGVPDPRLFVARLKPLIEDLK